VSEVKPGMKEIYEKHLANKPMLQGTDGSYMFDIEQHPGFGKGGPLLPCLITHGTIVSDLPGTESGFKILTSTERMLAMGEPIIKECLDVETDLRCYIGEGLATLTATARKRIGSQFEIVEG
jgi:hypothetical protein